MGGPELARFSVRQVPVMMTPEVALRESQASAVTGSKASAPPGRHVASARLTGQNLIDLMRENKVTIRQLALRMNVTMTRVREVRATGVTGQCMCLDWHEAITQTRPGTRAAFTG